MDTVTVTRPEQEYYQAVVAELDTTKAEQARLSLLRLYDETPVPDMVVGNHKDKTVFDFAFTDTQLNRRPPRGRPLIDRIAGCAARRQLLEDELAKWNAAEQAWVAAQPEAAPIVAGPAA